VRIGLKFHEGQREFDEKLTGCLPSEEKPVAEQPES
jgi:hypothetical protein